MNNYGNESTYDENYNKLEIGHYVILQEGERLGGIDAYSFIRESDAVSDATGDFIPFEIVQLTEENVTEFQERLDRQLQEDID